MIAHTITQHRLQQRQLLLSVAFPHLAWCPLRHTCSRHRPVSARDDGSSSSSGQCSACRAAAGEPFMPEQQTGQQQQPQPQQQSPALSSRDNIQLPNLTPPIPPRCVSLPQSRWVCVLLASHSGSKFLRDTHHPHRATSLVSVSPALLPTPTTGRPHRCPGCPRSC